MHAFADIAICSRINVAVPFSHRQRCGISFKIAVLQFLRAAALRFVIRGTSRVFAGAEGGALELAQSFARFWVGANVQTSS
jgi:hypothetical protein